LLNGFLQDILVVIYQLKSYIMSTIFTTVLLIICVIGLPMVFVFVSKRNVRKQKEKKLNMFLLSGANNGLDFSRQEILEDKIIGLDEINKTLLIHEFKNEDKIILINMVKVRACTFKKNYESINMGSEKKVRMEQHLTSINVMLEFKNGGDEPVSISFYDNKVNSIYEMTDLESKAKMWQTILSNIVLQKFKATA
jgi:hypothetical protein